MDLKMDQYHVINMENVHAKIMWLVTNVMNVKLIFLDFPTAEVFSYQFLSITANYCFLFLLDCHCDVLGSKFHVCDPINGICVCKPNIIGDKCTECDHESGFFGFPKCNKGRIF